MQKTLRTGVLLAGAMVLTLTSSAQKMYISSTDVAITANFEHAQLAQTGTPGFWLKGAALDGSVTLWRGMGVAANFTGEHAANIQGSVSLGKLAYMAGPRYTFSTSRFTDIMLRKRATHVFAEALFGGVHGFDGLFPSGANVSSSANAFSMQAGGGVDIGLARNFGIRALEMDWVHSTLPNNAGNSQNGLRIAFGVSYRR